jgi:hypothetical protein
VESRTRVEQGDEGWGQPGAEWARIERLLALARSAARDELSQEQRERIRERVLERWDSIQARRKKVRAISVGASIVALAGVLLFVVSRSRG